MEALPVVDVVGRVRAPAAQRARVGEAGEIRDVFGLVLVLLLPVLRGEPALRGDLLKQRVGAEEKAGRRENERGERGAVSAARRSAR